MGELLSFEPYVTALFVVGLSLMAGAWLPQLVVGRYVSAPFIHLGFGALLFGLHPELSPPDPLEEQGRAIWERLAEGVVVISLVGTGLKLDKREWRIWRVIRDLLLITMPLSIGLTALLGWWLLPLSVPAALLLGAVLAPTDPVLADDVQVGPPIQGKESRARFALTREAGLNDGLAFPFTYFAVWAATMGFSDPG